MAQTRTWVRCRIQRGMFDGEYVVLINALDEEGKPIEAVSFVDKDDLSMEVLPASAEGVVDGLVAISLMQIDPDKAKVVLPRPTVTNGPVVSVPRASLVSR